MAESNVIPAGPYLKGEVLAVRPEMGGSYALRVACGDVAFWVPVSADCFEKNLFVKGDHICMEYEKGTNILSGANFTRVCRKSGTFNTALVVEVSHG